MKKHVLRFALFAMIAIAGFSSCKKSKDDNLAVTSENMVGSYRLADIKMKSSLTGNAEASMMDQMEACDKDDLIKIQASNVLVIVDEGTKCENDATTTWKLEGQKLTLNGGGFISGVFDVVSFTKSQLIVSTTENDGGISVTYTVVLNRQ